MRRKRLALDFDGLDQIEQVTVTWYTDKGARLEEVTFSPPPFDDPIPTITGALDMKPRQGQIDV